MVDLKNECFIGLEEQNGLFYSGIIVPVSFPEEAYDVCFQVEDTSYWFRHRNECIKVLYDRFGRGKTVFDIGGGNGFVTKGLQDYGVNSVLVEPGLHGCLNAKARGVKNIVCGTLENNTFHSSSVPLIGCFDVIEHIEDAETFIRNVYNALEPGGIFILTVPAYNLLWSNEDVLAGHFRRYRLKTIIKDLEYVGFEKVFGTYLFSLLVVPIFMFRTLPDILGKNKHLDSKKAEKDHQSKGVLSKLFVWVLKWESNRIKMGKSIFFGSSCLVVMKKPE